MANEPTVDKSQLLGTWQLESWSIGYAGRDDVSFPFGEDPVGLLLYTEDDWMSVSISRRERAVLPADVPFRRIDAERLAGAFRDYFHYAGRYRLRGDDVVHYVTQSLNPNFVGSEQLRHVEIDGQTLVLSGRDEAAGETRFHHLVWHKLAAAS
jgi:hypothetical protein